MVIIKYTLMQIVLEISMCRRNGFTLIEVLIALCIVAIALFAIVKTVNSSNQSLWYLRQKTVATWLAQNTLAEFNSGLIPHVAIPGITQGDVRQLNQDWHWRLAIHPTKTHHIMSLVVTITQHQQVLVRLTSFKWVA